MGKVIDKLIRRSLEQLQTPFWEDELDKVSKNLKNYIKNKINCYDKKESISLSTIIFRITDIYFEI